MTEEDTFEALQLRIVIDDKGTKRYYNHDNQLHRKFGSAIECTNGYKAWWVNGQRHRTDGPAVEFADGSKEWYINGCLHRIDGPAVEYASGRKRWYINYKSLTEAEFLKHSLCTIK